MPYQILTSIPAVQTRPFPQRELTAQPDQGFPIPRAGCLYGLKPTAGGQHIRGVCAVAPEAKDMMTQPMGRCSPGKGCTEARWLDAVAPEGGPGQLVAASPDSSAPSQLTVVNQTRQVADQVMVTAEWGCHPGSVVTQLGVAHPTHLIRTPACQGWV